MNILFYVDSLAIIMGSLIVFVALCVAAFSWNYLKGDTSQTKFYLRLCGLVVSALVCVSANNIWLFVGAWGLNNLLLAQLMVHKPSWRAARESGKLALKNASVGLLFLVFAMIFAYLEANVTSIQAIVVYPYSVFKAGVILFCIFVAALAQSALWPFHRWLISSLNSPTPVSAIMHAGLINGGGFLLARFSPLYIQHHDGLNFVFLVGGGTALLGTLWKLMQSDVKRMLACSTMGQMGFMVMQCGLGLFSAAIAHLVWHGLFKAYLFLASGSAAQEKRLDLEYPPSVLTFLISLVFGVFGAYIFSLSSEIDLTCFDTRLFLVGMALVLSTQLAVSILTGEAFKNTLRAFFIVFSVNVLYGLSLHTFESFIPGISGPQPLSLIHVLAFVSLGSAWFANLFSRHNAFDRALSSWFLRLYVWMLNASQPSSKTITAYRNDYQYQ